MYWNAVLLMAWSLATVTAILDSTSHRYWEDTKPEETDRYQNDNSLKTYVIRGGNKHFVTSAFPGIYLSVCMIGSLGQLIKLNDIMFKYYAFQNIILLLIIRFSYICW